MVEPDKEVSVSVLTLVHTDISPTVLLGFSVVDAEGWGPRSEHSGVFSKARRLYLSNDYKKPEDQWHILNDFIHAYSHRARTDNPLGTNFWCQQKALITLPICCRFKKIALKSDFIYIFYVSPYVYSPGQGQIIHWGQNFDDNRKAFSLCPYVASFKMISSKSDFIHIFNDFIHVRGVIDKFVSFFHNIIIYGWI